MKITALRVLGTLLTLAASTTAQAPERWAFDNQDGFSAEAEFRLVNATTLEVVLRNTSEKIPAQYGGSNIILTGLSWDFGGASSIVGGTAMTGSGSMSVGFSTDVGANADVSGEWGFGNDGATNMRPNMISGNQSHMMPFGGDNLVGPANLAGPSGGVISEEGASRLGGQGAIQNEIVVTLALSGRLANLGFLSNGVRFEYGSDYVFGDGEPTCDIPAAVNPIFDQANLNANGALYAASNPVLGTSMQFCFDDPAGACGIESGSLAFFYYSRNTASIPVPFGGCGGGASELLIDVVNPYGIVGPLTWTGPGIPACFDVAIPNAADKCGSTFFAQGGFVSFGGGSAQVTLTNALEVILGQ